MQRAPYASDPAASRGREFTEEREGSRGPRSEFQRDRDRIVHSIAFRRLRSKTQVFIAPDGDHYRTRLTHSLEVAQIGRVLARELGLDEDLTEALCLGHDIGHPPFGHAGETALEEAMAHAGGYDHNAQGLRTLARLESPYCDHDGLNLTWETLEGLAKHNGPIFEPGWALAEIDRAFPLDLHSWPSLEAQVAAIADDIAYDNHDIDDGLRAGLFRMEDLSDVPLIGEIFAAVLSEYPGLEPGRIRHEAIRRLIGEMVNDCLTESGQRLKEAAPASAGDIRGLKAPVIAFSEPLVEVDQGIRGFLFANMYRHYRVNRMTSKARRVVQDLFGLLLAEPHSLPPRWSNMAGAPGSEQTARVAADYIAGMTDRFALSEHERLLDFEK